MIEEAPDRNFWWPEAFSLKVCEKTFLRSGVCCRWVGHLISKKESQNWKKRCFSALKLGFSVAFLGNLPQKSEKNKISKTLFRKWALKCRWGGSRSKFFVCRGFFIETLSKKFFEVGDPKNRRFWAFFQKSMSEISANSGKEKTCFSRPRFFWKVEEMRVILGGAP